MLRVLLLMVTKACIINSFHLFIHFPATHTFINAQNCNSSTNSIILHTLLKQNVLLISVTVSIKSDMSQYIITHKKMTTILVTVHKDSYYSYPASPWLKNSVFWEEVLCSVLKIYWHFGRTWPLHFTWHHISHENILHTHHHKDLKPHVFSALPTKN